MAGVKSQAYLYQIGANVQVDVPIDSARWQIHELPVDYSVDPKLRCKPEYVGRFLQYSSGNGDYIYNVTTASLVMHSLVFFDKDEPVACASITPFSLPSSAVSAVFQSGVFGKIYIIQWRTGEHSVCTIIILYHALLQCVDLFYYRRAINKTITRVISKKYFLLS